MGLKSICDPSQGVKPVIIMLLVQGVFSGANIFYKLALGDGMSVRVLISYRFIFATAFLLPLVLIFERKSKAELTWKIAFQGLLSGLFGGPVGLNLFLESMSLTSVTFATAINNLIPAVTFILVLTLRMERLAIRTLAGKAKLVGTVVSLGGAMILNFYKGKEISLWSTNINLAKHGGDHQVTMSHTFSNQVLGSILGISCCLSFSIWNIIHAKLSENYPYTYSCSALMSITAAILSIIYAIVMERNWSEWKLGWNIRLWSSFYTGAINSGLMVAVFTWCIRLKGPFFLSIFMPCMLIYTYIAGYLFLNERLHIGSILGSVIITIGVYIILWGKAEETKFNPRQGEQSEVVGESRRGDSHPIAVIDQGQGDVAVSNAKPN